MFEDIPIKFIKGTYRVKDPVDTYDSNEEKLRTAGITRITEITHLDRVKIPVFSSIRPTAQSGGGQRLCRKRSYRRAGKSICDDGRV